MSKLIMIINEHDFNRKIDEHIFRKMYGFETIGMKSYADARSYLHTDSSRLPDGIIAMQGLGREGEQFINNDVGPLSQLADIPKNVVVVSGDYGGHYKEIFSSPFIHDVCLLADVKTPAKNSCDNYYESMARLLNYQKTPVPAKIFG